MKTTPEGPTVLIYHYIVSKTYANRSDSLEEYFVEILNLQYKHEPREQTYVATMCMAKHTKNLKLPNLIHSLIGILFHV